ncbi:MAG: peptidylprolyl isomerase [Bacteroidales bacterium]|nr:peptidylprolyl isomerase [Bacteroidales bacterium]
MKKILRILFLCFFAAGFLQSCSVLRNPLKVKNYVEIETTAGSFVVGLYQGTPAHRDNFMKKCSSNFYNETMVYNAVRNSEYSFGLRKGFSEKDMLAADFDSDRTLPAEFNEKILPLRGTVAMKRIEGPKNPEKKSDASLFFIIDGSKNIDIHEIKTTVAIRNRDTYKIYIDKFLTLPENKVLKDSLDALHTMKTMKLYNELYATVMKMVKPQIENDGVELFSISENNIDKYKVRGGVPMFEGFYTVFGEIVVGMDILDKLSKVETDLDRSPKNGISIVSTFVLKKKDFKKKYK